jgi:two-component system sensor histidine kinase/response regulator
MTPRDHALTGREAFEADADQRDRSPLERHTDLLRRRLRGVCGIAVLALALYCGRDLLADAPLDRWLLVDRAGAAAALAAVLVSLRLPPWRAWPRVLCLIAMAAICAEAAIAATVREVVGELHLLLALVTIGSATLIPWGAATQLAVALSAEAAMLGHSLLLTGSFEHAFAHSGLAATAAFLGSVYVALELDRSRAKLAERERERDQAEAALRRSEAYFRSLFENAPDLISVVDAQGVITYDSPSHQRVLGYAPRDRLGSNALDLIHPDDAARMLALFAEGIRNPGSAASAEYRYRHRDGSWRHIEAVGTNLLHDPAVKGVIVNSRDVTERKHTEEALKSSQEYLKAIFEFAPDAYYLSDIEGRFLDGNRAAEEVVGYNRKELVGESFLSLGLLPGDQLSKAAALLAVSMAGHPTGPDELVLNRKDGTRVTVEVRTFPIRIKGESIILGIARDIGERKRAEVALQQAKEAAETANRAKSEFLANMSHEVRTPMNGVIGMTELVLDTELLPEQREYLEMAKSSAESLLTVINDILDFSKIEAGKLEIDCVPFDLQGVIRSAMRPLTLRAHKKDLEIACDVAPELPPVLLGDPARLRQVLVNLVGNAIKFTEKGEVVLRIEEEAAAADGLARLRFAVRDTGIGIPKEKHDLVFRAFEQVDGSMTRRYGGSGLGLTITTQLVCMMGGRIGVESEPGRGSVFHFVLPFGVGDPTALSNSTPDASFLRRLPVLVVDDNATNRQILEAMLSNWQMRPALATGGDAALEMMRAGCAANAPYRLILLDARMPGIDGFTVAARILEDPSLAGATVMMLTSDGQSGDIARCRELGVSAYIFKPISQSELFDAIVTALGQKPDGGGVVERRAGPTAAGEKGANGLHVLLVEDHPVNQRLALRLLEKQGHQVEVAGNGREALAMLSRARFDVVLMDVQMPELDGLETTRCIRTGEQDAGGHLPIIAMTAHAMSGDEERCLSAGMDGYVSKPIDSRNLLRAIAAAVAAK